MSEPTWAEGYVVDVGYTHGYYRELAPAALSFVTNPPEVAFVESAPGVTGKFVEAVVPVT